MILQYFFKKENNDKILAKSLYLIILKSSNQYLSDVNLFKAINFKTSFEIISLFLIITLKINIKNNFKNHKIINQYLIDNFILDIDESLRTEGIGDISIGKYVKKYVKKFYFRITKFEQIVDLDKFETTIEYLNYFNVIDNSNNNSSIISNKTQKMYEIIEKIIFEKLS
tara:strand:- start:2090 stop:2596 length:507 start_codon:yes stop_codon:yes gene_type:complete